MIPRLRTVLLVMVLSATFAAPVRAQEAVVLLPHSSETYGIDLVVPEGWTDLGQGLFARQQDAGDATTIAQQAIPFFLAEEVLTALLPQLALTEAPESVCRHEGSALTWTLYQVDVDVSGVTVDLALAYEEGTTYVALLQSAPAEYAALHDSIFLPMLDAFVPHEGPTEPVPYDVEEVSFANGDLTLAGTLTLPPGPGPHPVTVLISGSEPQDRDETLGSGIAIQPFRLLADALTREGVAVLRYDDRGVGESTGTYYGATIQDFAADAEAAIRYLATREEIDPEQIGVLGHSEGGLVAAMLGARNDDLDFIISLAGPSVIGRDVFLVQNQRMLEVEGATVAQVEDQVAFIEEVLANRDDAQAVEALIYAQTLEQAAALPEAERRALGDLEQYAQSMAKQSAQQITSVWFETFLAYDPATDWGQTTVPVLAIFGGKDVQVDAEQNAPSLREALREAGNDDVDIVILPNANHLFQEAETGGLGEYMTLPAELTPELLPAIIDWLNGHVVTAAPVSTPVLATPVQ